MNDQNILTSMEGALYIRVSTEDQTELSPDAQKRLLLEYAKSHNIHISPVHIYQDNGISGRSTAKRPSFQQMIAEAKGKEHPFDIIIVWKFSRFARNQEESILYKSLLSKNHVDVVSITENTTGEFGKLIERIIEWMDEYYSIRLSGEVTRGMTENALRGRYQADAPIGYISVGNGQPPVKDPNTIMIPLKMKDLLLSGSTMMQIARKLNAAGYRTKRGNLWDNRGVRYVLENPFYAGISRWNYSDRGRRLKPSDEVIYADGNWEPLWDKDTYDQIVARIVAMSQQHRRRDVSTTFHWLGGIVQCSCCGANLGHSGTKQSPAYNCWKYTRGVCHESHYISVPKLEALVIDYLESLPSSGALSYTVIRSQDPTNTNRIDEIKRQLQRLDTRGKRIREAYQNEIDTLEEYKENKALLQKEKDRLTAELNQLVTEKPLPDQAELDRKMRINIRNLITILKDADIDNTTKGNAIRECVDHMTFDRKNTSLDIYLKLVL